MSSIGDEATKHRTPYTRWERSIEHGTTIIGAMQQILVELGVNLLDVKPSDTATVSIATAQNFKDAAEYHNVELDYPSLATKFLRSTGRTGLRPTYAKLDGVGFIKGRVSPRIDSSSLRIVMNFSSQTMQQECTGINTLLHRAPYRGNVHISVANVETHGEAERLEIVNYLSRLMVGDTFKFNPIMQKKCWDR